MHVIWPRGRQVAHSTHRLDGMMCICDHGRHHRTKDHVIVSSTVGCLRRLIDPPKRCQIGMAAFHDSTSQHRRRGYEVPTFRSPDSLIREGELSGGSSPCAAGSASILPEPCRRDAAPRNVRRLLHWPASYHFSSCSCIPFHVHLKACSFKPDDSGVSKLPL